MPKKKDNKGHKKGHDKNKDKGGKQHKGSGGLYDPRTTLEGKKLRKAVNALVRRQSRPAIRGARDEVESLRGVLDSQVGDVRRLGNQAQENIGSYYHSLAQAEAQNLDYQRALANRLNTGIGQAGQNAASAISGAGEQALGQFDKDAALRGQANTSARDELIAMVAQQQALQGREQAALAAQGQAQGAGFENLHAALGQAAQARGATQRSDVSRTTLQNVKDLQNQFNPEIRKALLNLREQRTAKGELKTEILSRLRGEERDYLLSKGALGVDKKQLSADIKESKQSHKNQADIINRYKDLARLKAKLSRKGQSLSASQNKELAKLKGQISKKNIKLSHKGSSGGGSGGGSGAVPKESKHRAVDVARSAFSGKGINWKTVRKSRKAKRDTIAYLVSHGVNSEAARWLVAKRTKKKKGGGGRQPYGRGHGYDSGGFH